MGLYYKCPEKRTNCFWQVSWHIFDFYRRRTGIFEAFCSLLGIGISTYQFMRKTDGNHHQGASTIVKEISKRDFHFSLQLYDSLVVSVAAYGSFVWGLKFNVSSKIDSILSRYLKSICGIPRTTRNYSVLREFSFCCFKCSSLFRALMYLCKLATSQSLIFYFQWFVGLSNVEGTYMYGLSQELSKRNFSMNSLGSRAALLLSDRNSVSLIFFAYCCRFHLIDDDASFSTLAYFQNKSPAPPKYLSFYKYRQLFSAFRLNSFMYLWDFTKSNASRTVCCCGEELSSFHILDHCVRFSESRRNLLFNAGFSDVSTTSVFSLFDVESAYPCLFDFLTKVWLCLTHTVFCPR